MCICRCEGLKSSEFQYIEVLELDLFFCLSRSPVLPFLLGLTPIWGLWGLINLLTALQLLSGFNQWKGPGGDKRGRDSVWVPESFFLLVPESLEVISDPSLPALDFTLFPVSHSFVNSPLVNGVCHGFPVGISLIQCLTW